MEIQQKDRIFRSGQRVIDLGAAPGGWCEYASEFSGDKGCLIAVDLLPIEPIADVEILQGDFSDQDTLDRLMNLVGSKSFDLVLSDMAPNFSGMESVDQPKAIYLAELAFELANKCLSDKGIFVTKLFQGEGFESLISDLRQGFRSVKLRKPDASRPKSREIYAVCRDLK